MDTDTGRTEEIKTGVTTLWGTPLAHPLTDGERERIEWQSGVLEKWAHMEALAQVGKALPDPDSVLPLAPALGTVLDSLHGRRVRRSEAEDLYRVLSGMGCILWVECGSLRCEPWTIIPESVRAQILSAPMREQLEDICDEQG